MASGARSRGAPPSEGLNTGTSHGQNGVRLDEHSIGTPREVEVKRSAGKTPRHPAQESRAPRSESTRARGGSLRKLEGRGIPRRR